MEILGRITVSVAGCRRVAWPRDHDAGITLESRMAIEVMDAALEHQARRLGADNFRFF